MLQVCACFESHCRQKSPIDRRGCNYRGKREKRRKSFRSKTFLKETSTQPVTRSFTLSFLVFFFVFPFKRFTIPLLWERITASVQTWQQMNHIVFGIEVKIEWANENLFTGYVIFPTIKSDNHLYI